MLRKHSRWSLHRRRKRTKQTSIRIFIAHQTNLYDYGFFKPQGKPSESDPDMWGHVMEPISPKETIRILLQNPNGIQPHFSYSDFLFGLHMCETIGVGVLCMPETNLDWQPSQVAAAVKCFKKTWMHSAIQVSHGEEQFQNSYKPGGTFTAAMGSWTSRVVEHGVDPYGLGWWSYLALQGKRAARIYLITVYRVCNNKDSGPKTTYRQQFRGLSEAFRNQKEHSVPDPYHQCIKDLQAWIESLTRQDHSIILSLDSNEDISETVGKSTPLDYKEGIHPIAKTHNGSLASLMVSCGLVDPLRHQHAARPFPATYNRGNSRLDYILVSASILPAVQRSGILPYNSIFYSNHWSCYLDIDSTLLFEDPTFDMQPRCRRQLQLHDPLIVQTYNETLQKQLHTGHNGAMRRTTKAHNLFMSLRYGTQHLQLLYIHTGGC
jgi:hypothetical protein